MIFYVISAFSIVAFGLSVAEELMLPVATCKRSSANYSTCLTRAAQESWPRFVEGLPEFDWPLLDPLFLTDIKAIFNRGAVHGKVSMSNNTIEGLSKTRFLNIKPHFLDEVFRLEVYTLIPKITINGDCNAEGTLNEFRMVGKGHYNVTLDVISATWNLIGPVINDTWTVEHFITSPSVEKMKIYFKDLFGSSPEINDIVVIFVNEYWPAIYRTMLPTMTETWDPWLTSLCNRFFSKVPFSKLFPEN